VSLGDGGKPTGEALRPSQVLCLHSDGDSLVVLVEVDGRDLPVTVPLSHAAAHALRHLYALHGHRWGCPGGVQVHVDLLRRSLQAAGAWPLCVLIRPDPDPAFWLRVMTGEGPVEVDVGVLDAAALLLSRRFPIAVVGADAGVWEDTFGRLLEGDER
jgi:hypothetical protein